MEENIDYYFNDQGLMVLTRKFLLERGYCCGNGCLHCPYNHEAVPLKKEKLHRPINAQGGSHEKKP